MISERLRGIALRNRDALAVIDGGQRISYGELFLRVDAAREWFQTTLDPKPGDVIALSLDNSWQFAACVLAASELGVVLMPCNPQWRAAELRTFAEQLRFRGAVIEPRCSPEWHHMSDLISNNCVLSMPAQFDSPGSSPPSDSPPDDAPALYLATSGSTGAPRLVLRSHRNVLATAENVARTLDIGPDRRFLSVVPFHYAYGFSNSLILPLLSGATLVLVRQFTPGACADLVQREKVDTLFGSPYIFGSLADRDPALLSSLKWCYTGGGRTPSSVVGRWRVRFGINIRQQYGTSEAGVIAIERAAHATTSSRGTCTGSPICGVEVMVLGAGGQSLSGAKSANWRYDRHP